tara:strand:- start:3558 stop:4103 length:546 start_codon:yes stop_codon:yes gene_type:complete
MRRILIVSALKQELPDIDNVLYTGVGKINATYKLTELLTRVYGKDRFDLVINYGTAASKTYSGLVDCTKFIQRDMDATPMGLKIGETPFDNEPSMIDFSHIKNPIGKNLTCYTGDSFVTDIQDMDIVDMEAYALAKTCRNFEIDFVSCKYISDDGNADDWEKNCGKGAEEFKKVLEYYDTI